MTFKMIVSFTMYHPIKQKIEKKELDCETKADSKVQAIEQTKQWYAKEMGMRPQDIKINKVIQVG